MHKLDRVQESVPWLAFPLGVVKKFSDDQSGNLAALIAYYAFFSIFPLILVFVTILGFVLGGDPALEHKVFDTALGQFPIIGNGQRSGLSFHPLTGSVFGLVAGTVLSLWSGLGVANAAQNAFNTVYGVSRADRPNFVRRTAHSLVLIMSVGVGLILTTLLSTAVTGAGSIGLSLGVGGRIVGAVIAIVLNTAVFAFAFNWLTVRDVAYRDVLPGAAVAAVAWQILQYAGTALVTHKVRGASGTYGTFAVVIGLIFWFYLQAQITLLCAEINVVRQFRLWPRALVGEPKTDADYRALEGYAELNRYVHHEGVETRFHRQQGDGEGEAAGGFDRGRQPTYPGDGAGDRVQDSPQR